MTKKKKIIKDYSKIKNKSKFIQKVADKTGIAYGTVKNHWLCASGGFSVPGKYQDLVIKLLQNTIKNQKK